MDIFKIHNVLFIVKVFDRGRQNIMKKRGTVYLIIIYQEPYPYNINAVVIYKWLGHDR